MVSWMLQIFIENSGTSAQIPRNSRFFLVLVAIYHQLLLLQMLNKLVGGPEKPLAAPPPPQTPLLHPRQVTSPWPPQTCPTPTHLQVLVPYALTPQLARNPGPTTPLLTRPLQDLVRVLQMRLDEQADEMLINMVEKGELRKVGLGHRV